MGVALPPVGVCMASVGVSMASVGVSRSQWVWHGLSGCGMCGIASVGVATVLEYCTGLLDRPLKANFKFNVQIA